MKTAIICLGLFALVGSSTASLDAFKSVKESQELEHTGGEHSKSCMLMRSIVDTFYCRSRAQYGFSISMVGKLMG